MYLLYSTHAKLHMLTMYIVLLCIDNKHVPSHNPIVF